MTAESEPKEKQSDNSAASRLATTATGKRDIVTRWGDEAYDLLMAIKGQQVQKRRVTLLRLADYRIAAAPLLRVYDRPDTINESNHYKHLRTDPVYKKAHQHLTNLALGIVQARQAAEIESAAAVVEHAAARLGLLSQSAVDVLESGLKAEKAIVVQQGEHMQYVEYVTDYGERRQAANSILDRSPQTAKSRKVQTEEKAPQYILDLVDMLREGAISAETLRAEFADDAARVLALAGSTE